MQAVFQIATAMAVLTGPLDDQGAGGVSGFAVEFCVTRSIPRYDIDVPAEQAGRIRSIEHYEGDTVVAGSPLVQIDDAQPAAQREVAFKESEIAAEQAANDVNVRYAEAAFKVAEQQYEMVRAANQGVKNAVTKAEIYQRWFEMKRAHLQIEQARFDLHIAGLTAKAREAEVHVADLVIERHKIKAPFDGQVTDVMVHAGEWVGVGDPILHMSRIDQLQVIGNVKVSALDPYEVANRPVTIVAELSRGRRATFEGKVVHVPSKIGASREFEVWANVKNEMADGEWILQDGREVTMYIELDPNRTVRQDDGGRQ